MIHLLLVALGGAIGAGCRHLVNLAVLRMFAPAFPYATLTANVLGGLLMGIAAGYFALRYEGGGQGLRLFVTTGMLGGFTTFSAFSLDAVVLWERGDVVSAVAYVLLSVVLSLAALMAGLFIMRTAA
jgi:fluoride exporter